MQKFRFWPAGLLSALFLLGTARATENADPLRLTREVEPLAQSVELTLDPAKDDFSGRVLIDVVAQVSFQTFRIHALGPVFTTATLTNPAGQATVLTPAVTHAELGIVSLTAPAALPAGPYRLTIDFTAKYRRDGLGLYKTVSRGDAYLFTQLEDHNARNVFPCWDEPEFKVNWQLTLKVPTGLEVVSNAPAAQESRDPEWKTVAFGRTPPMPAYIVALAVGPFEYVPVPGLSVPGRIITPRGQSGLAAVAVRLSPPLLSRLEEYFGLPYPYAKLDQLAVPEYVYGAMENAGLITYTDTGLLMDPDRPSFSTRRQLASTMAHEMAHMWFGDLVTMQWWDDVWLNESFASWLSGRIVQQQFPEFRINIQDIRGTHFAMSTDALPSVSALRRPVTATTDLTQLVDVLTYNKGQALLTMAENWIGPDRFRTAMRTYCLQHRWGNATSADLWAALGSVSGDNIGQILSAFLNQPGLPLVSFSLEADGKLQITQRRFNNLGDPQLPGKWQVPIALTWSKDGQLHHERLLLTETSQLFAIPALGNADWIYPNTSESGYYRWSLSPELNARLARKTAALSPLERVGLLSNTSALFNAGLIDGTDYLAYVTAFGRDLDPDVNSSVIGSITGLEGTFITPASRPAYDAYVASLLRPVLDRIGLQAAAGEPDNFGPLRRTLYGTLGYKSADPSIVAECRRLAGLFLENPGKVDPSLRGTALSVAAYHGDAALYDTFQAALEKAKAPASRSALIGALGNFHDAALYARALAYSLTPALNSTEFTRIVMDGAGDPDRRELAVDWIMANYPAIATKAPPEYTAGLIRVVSGAEPELFNKLRDFLLAPERKTEFGEINIKKSADRLAVRMRLRAKEQANVVKFLSTYPGHTPKD